MKNKYYSLDAIKKKNALYNVIYGERSNGKTFAVLKEGVKRYWENGEELAIIRRWDTDFKSGRGMQTFDSLCHDGNGENQIEILSMGLFTDVVYKSRKWYFCKYEEDGTRVVAAKPFAYAFALSSMEHDKSTSYPLVTTILFDEFLTKGMYLPDEFVLFENVLSTIIRDRDNVTIYMCGNTVNKYAPYFKEMGLNHVKDQEQGTIELYEYGETGLSVAVQFSDSPNKKNKKSNKYFAFDNPKLQMITGNGNVWEMNIYPHCPCEILNKDIKYIYFIKFDNEILQCEIVYKKDNYFTYIHKKTTPLKLKKYDIVFSTDYEYNSQYRRNILNGYDKIGRKILQFYKEDRIYYQSNDIGELVANYLNWCKSH